MTIYYKKGYKYQLNREHQFTLPPYFSHILYADDYISIVNCLVTVKRGYAWDGPSGPTVDTENFMQGSLRHDVKYQLMRIQLLPQTYGPLADTQLIEDCREDGMCYIRGQWVYVGVKYGAASAADPTNRKRVIEAGKPCLDYVYA